MSETEEKEVLVRYTGVSGSSVENGHGVWNLQAPETYKVGEEDVAHPQSPVKIMTASKAAKLMKTHGGFQIEKESDDV